MVNSIRPKLSILLVQNASLIDMGIFMQENVTMRSYLGFLWFIVGVAAWMTINSLFQELPLLVNKAPEGWSLASYLVLIIQAGNLGPFLHQAIGEKQFSYFSTSVCIISLSILSMVGLSFTWSWTM